MWPRVAVLAPHDMKASARCGMYGGEGGVNFVLFSYERGVRLRFAVWPRRGLQSSPAEPPEGCLRLNMIIPRNRSLVHAGTTTVMKVCLEVDPISKAASSRRQYLSLFGVRAFV